MNKDSSVDKGPRTPHRIETERLVLRCYEPADADALRIVCAESREHLLPWLPWASADPQTLDEKLEVVLSFRSSYDADKNCIMGIFDKTTANSWGHWTAPLRRRGLPGDARDRLLDLRGTGRPRVR